MFWCQRLGLDVSIIVVRCQHSGIPWDNFPCVHDLFKSSNFWISSTVLSVEPMIMPHFPPLVLFMLVLPGLLFSKRWGISARIPSPSVNLQILSFPFGLAIETGPQTYPRPHHALVNSVLKPNSSSPLLAPCLSVNILWAVLDHEQQWDKLFFLVFWLAHFNFVKVAHGINE